MSLGSETPIRFPLLGYVGLKPINGCECLLS